MDTKKVLSHLAIDKGMSLNKFIERLLQETAEAAEDAAKRVIMMRVLFLS